MTMDICYLDQSGLNVSLLNATQTNLSHFTMAVATLLEKNAEDCEDYLERSRDQLGQRTRTLEELGGDGYDEWLNERVEMAARDAAEANEAVANWGTFWHENTNVTVSSMLLAVNAVMPDLPPQQMGYGQLLLTEGIKVLRDLGDLNLRIL